MSSFLRYLMDIINPANVIDGGFSVFSILEQSSEVLLFSCSIRLGLKTLPSNLANLQKQTHEL
jgi:hypothetical protein